MARSRITQGDIARQARVDRSTVTLALKGDPRIHPDTKARIKRIAEKLGYVPDPVLSALNAYRTQKRPAAFQGTLAWMVRTTAGYDWQDVPHYRRYYEGAVVCARKYGFRIEIFELNTPQMTLVRLAQILRARNISGLLVCPQPQAHVELDFPWDNFSAVTFSYTLARPCLHTVATNHYHAMVRVMQELRRFAYQRIVFAMSDLHNERTDDNYLAGYLVGCNAVSQSPIVPPLVSDWQTDTSLEEWLRQCQPDAIISGDYLILERLRKLRIKVPQELGVACPCLPQPDANLSGMVDGSTRIGAVGVDTLVAMLNRGERGVPEEPLRIHVEGRWNPGRSLQSRPGHGLLVRPAARRKQEE